MAVCQGLVGEGGSSSSLLASRLRSLGDWLAERLKNALRLGVEKALGVVSTHYIVNFELLVIGYIVPDGDDDAKVDAVEQADAAAEGAASTLAELLESELLPERGRWCARWRRRPVDCMGRGAQVDKLGLCLDFIFLCKGTKT